VVRSVVIRFFKTDSHNHSKGPQKKILADKEAYRVTVLELHQAIFVHLSDFFKSLTFRHLHEAVCVFLPQQGYKIQIQGEPKTYSD